MHAGTRLRARQGCQQHSVAVTSWAQSAMEEGATGAARMRDRSEGGSGGQSPRTAREPGRGCEERLGKKGAGGWEVWRVRGKGGGGWEVLLEGQLALDLGMGMCSRGGGGGWLQAERAVPEREESARGAQNEHRKTRAMRSGKGRGEEGSRGGKGEG